VITSDRGSTVPLIVCFFLVAFLVVAGAVAAGQAFVQQRDLQDLCDGAAAAAAAAGADIDRGRRLGEADALQFTDVQAFVDSYVLRERPDAAHGGVVVAAHLSDGDRTIRLRCAVTSRVAFGALFGKSRGVRHVVYASAREPVT
jgi:Flp pilus assembly protein TadG